MKSAIAIRWETTTEYVEIDFDHLRDHAPILSTREHWPDEKLWVTYRTTSNMKVVGNGVFTLTISYERKKNRDPTLSKGGARFGRSRITFKRPFHRGVAVWEDVSDSSYNDECPWKRAAGGIIKKVKHQQAAVRRVERKQTEFRHLLIGIYGACAITGEHTKGSLEAAHIVPSHSGGSETIENGVLLRADLHRMYDAGVFTIDPKGLFHLAKGVDVSERYRKLIAGTRLPPAVLHRVQNALAHKLANLPRSLDD